MVDREDLFHPDAEFSTSRGDEEEGDESRGD